MSIASWRTDHAVTIDLRELQHLPDVVLPVSAADTRRHLGAALTTLAATPERSALPRPTTRQQRTRRAAGIATGLLLLAGWLVLAAQLLATVAVGVATLAYLAVVVYRVQCVRRAVAGADVITVTDEVARAVADADLPAYTVLVPAYREPEVIGQLVAELAALDYPADKLQVLVLLEADDPDTLAALRAAAPPSYVRAVLVPAAAPRTKPKACNYGLQLATGELLTIFDAEDRPEPLQLRKAAIAFAALPADVACLQARLSLHNADQNLLTAWFAAEYVTWFRHFLPGLVALGAPIPLGGTSNHVRVRVLREVGAWDPWNVTEDADLGLRLARAGHRVEVLDATTDEEANSDFVNWAKQRSRWYKGYLVTWWVNMRHPRQLRRDLGWRGFVGFTLFVGGTPLLALLNPVFWGLGIVYFVGDVHAVARIFPDPVYYPAMIAWIVGNLAMVYVGVYSLREAAREDLFWQSLIVPAYWVMMALAAIKAAVQLVRTPALWEKTTHGLDVQRAPARRLGQEPTS
jgi:cellulose synthase/poly-beta-1,6-N-acetylglucosamine synthase-like glycosyltransferase